MTREEAIEVLQQDIPCEQDTDLIEALDMAIKVLEQQPCKDVVSRQTVDKLKSDIMSWINSDNRGNADYFIVDKVEELVKGFNPPSVQPRIKTGKWILNNNQGVQAVGYLTYHCSECGRELSSKYHGKVSLLEEYPYCHCGAKMESEDKE